MSSLSFFILIIVSFYNYRINFTHFNLLLMRKVFVFICCLFAISSCQNLDILEAPVSKINGDEELSSFRLINGILAFKNAEELFKAAESIGAMSSEEYDKWKSDLSFQSQYSDFLETLSTNISDISNQKYSSIYLNEENNRLELNNVNTNYGKITNPLGLVIIGDSTYQFSAKKIRSIKGYDEEKLKYLLTSGENELIAHGITQTEVIELSAPNNNARVAPWEKFQTGNVLHRIDDKDGNFYINARLKAVNYVVGISLRQSIDLTASFYRDMWGTNLYTPQKFEATWSFQIFEAPCGLCVPVLTTHTGSYIESGVHSIAKTIFDAPAYIEVYSMNLPVSAHAYNDSGVLLASSTTFLFSE